MLNLLTGLLVLLNVADAGLTLYLIKDRLAYEANPIMAYLLNESEGHFLCVKVGLGFVFAGILRYGATRYSFVPWVIGVLAVLQALVVVRSLYYIVAGEIWSF